MPIWWKTEHNFRHRVLQGGTGTPKVPEKAGQVGLDS